MKFLKKGIMTLVVTCVTFISVYTTSYAMIPLGDNSEDYIWGEDCRHYLDAELDFYKDLKQTPLVNLSYDLHKLANEYNILSDTIHCTDQWIFINGSCADLIWVDNFVDFVNYVEGGNYRQPTHSNIKDMMRYMDCLVNEYNIEETFNSFDSQAFSLWWYSLGENYTKYIHIINNINRLTYKVNISVDAYNKEYGTSYEHIELLRPFYETISYNECEARYRNIIDYYDGWEENRKRGFYPQG